MKQFFEFIDDKSSKFWEIEIADSVINTRYGKIGSSGQLTTKEFDAVELAQKEYQKLVKEKTGKGYQEMVDDPNETPAEKLIKLFGFMAETPDEEALLSDLAACVRGIEKVEGNTEITFENNGAEIVVSCGQPGKPARGVSKSYAAIGKKFDSIIWEYGGGGWMGYCGLNEDGELANDGGWECEALEEGDNVEFLSALENKELEIEDVIGAFSCGQNWILFDPTRKNKRGEPALGFVSHGDCEWVPVESADHLSSGGFLLRMMAWDILERDDLIDEIYS